MSFRVDLQIRPLIYQDTLRTTQSFKDRQSTLVTVRGSNITGIGESAPLPAWTEGSEECRKTLRSIGQQGPYSLDDFGSVLEQLDGTPAARHGLHQALLDLKSTRQNQSIAGFLRSAGTKPSPIEVNDLIPGTPTFQQLIDSTRNGYRIIKIKVTPDNLDKLRTFSLFESDYDHSARLRIDFNESVKSSRVTNLPEILQSLPLDYVEQPFERTDLQTPAELKEHGIRVALDESLKEFTVDEISRHRAADALVIKPMMVGGIDRARTLIEQTIGNDLEPVLTTSLEGAVGRAGTTQLARAYSEELSACGLATGKHLRNGHNWEKKHLEEGYLQLPERTGNGLPEELKDEFQ